MNYARSIDELQQRAVTWWPAELSNLQSESSIIPILLQTRGKFVSLLKLAGNDPFDIFELAKTADFPGNLLLKHLAVLTDIGGEGLKRIGSDFINLFPKDPESGLHYMDFTWGDKQLRYQFQTLPLEKGDLGNPKLGLDGVGINTPQPLSDLHKDVIAILLHAAANIDETVALKSDFYKCVLGGILGNESEIGKFVEERYIWVSRITGGATANDLGQIAQTWVYEQLVMSLESTYTVTKNGKVLIDGENLTSDVLVTKNGKHVGVEVSFQVTTNSTIERKGNEAENRRNLMHRKGHFVAYIIDGAGNFDRRSAVSKICNNSDCTVAFSLEELAVLTQFIKDKLN
jgi:hypothetical protein